MIRWRRLVVLFLCVYLLVVAAVAFWQRGLLYFPTRQPEPEVLSLAASLELQPWRAADGTIAGWQRRGPRGPAARRPANKLLVFHGNAGMAIHRVDYLLAFEAIDGGARWEVWLAEYPGYGARPGEPGRESFRRAGQAAIDQLHALDARPLFLMGESLGGGVAAELAGTPDNRVAGLVLVTPFARLSEVAQKVFPVLPAGLILRDRWDNQSALTGFRRPVAVLIADQDEVVGAAQGRRLFEALPGPKRSWRFPKADHNSPEIHSAAWAGEVSSFLLEPVTGNP